MCPSKRAAREAQEPYRGGGYPGNRLPGLEETRLGWRQPHQRVPGGVPRYVETSFVIFSLYFISMPLANLLYIVTKHGRPTAEIVKTTL